MRIITGTARGVRLETLDGESTRPTVERIKESIFSMIQFDIEGRRVLDLFAGSGQLGLETLSRGAAKAVMVDIDRNAADIIKRNAQKTKLFDKCTVLTTDYKMYIRGAMNREQFDIIFLDPPYDSDFLEDALNKICEGDMIADNGFVICESDNTGMVSHEFLRLHKHVRYGKTYITILTKPVGDDE